MDRTEAVLGTGIPRPGYVTARLRAHLVTLALVGSIVCVTAAKPEGGAPRFSAEGHPLLIVRVERLPSQRESSAPDMIEISADTYRIRSDGKRLSRVLSLSLGVSSSRLSLLPGVADVVCNVELGYANQPGRNRRKWLASILCEALGARLEEVREERDVWRASCETLRLSPATDKPTSYYADDGRHVCRGFRTDEFFVEIENQHHVIIVDELGARARYEFTWDPRSEFAELVRQLEKDYGIKLIRDRFPVTVFRVVPEQP